jgi:hypothetical protein
MSGALYSCPAQYLPAARRIRLSAERPIRIIGARAGSSLSQLVYRAIQAAHRLSDKSQCKPRMPHACVKHAAAAQAGRDKTALGAPAAPPIERSDIKPKSALLDSHFGLDGAAMPALA